MTQKRAALLLVASMLLTGTITDECNPVAGKEIAKGVLEPYIYDASRIAYFYSDEKFSRMEFEVSLFSTEEYRIVFVAQGEAKEKIEIIVWDKPVYKKNRKKIFSSVEEKGDLAEKGIYTLEVSGGNAVFVEYRNKNGTSPVSGCIIFVLGFGI